MEKTKEHFGTSPFAAKKLARLVAVQSLYQASYGEESLTDILKNVSEDVQAVLNDEEGEGETISGRPNAELLNDIVFGVEKNKEALEEMLKGALDSRITFANIEKLLRLLLLAGAYELHHNAKTDAPIIISDYVDVARAFYNGKEPGLVNAVLDKLARVLRS